MKNFFRNTCLSFVILGAGFCTDVTAMKKGPLSMAASTPDGENLSELVKAIINEGFCTDVTATGDPLAAGNPLAAAAAMRTPLRLAASEPQTTKKEINSLPMDPSVDEIAENIINEAVQGAIESLKDKDDLAFANDLFGRKDYFFYKMEEKYTSLSGNVLLYRKNETDGYVVLTSGDFTTNELIPPIKDYITTTMEKCAFILTPFAIISGIKKNEDGYIFSFDDSDRINDQWDNFLRARPDWGQTKGVAEKLIVYLQILRDKLKEDFDKLVEGKDFEETFDKLLEKDSELQTSFDKFKYENFFEIFWESYGMLNDLDNTAKVLFKKELFNRIKGVKNYKPEEQQIVTKYGVDKTEAFETVIECIKKLMDEHESYKKALFREGESWRFEMEDYVSPLQETLNNIEIELWNMLCSFLGVWRPRVALPENSKKIVNFAFHTEAQAIVLQAIDPENFGNFKKLYSLYCPCTNCQNFPLIVSIFSNVEFWFKWMDNNCRARCANFRINFIVGNNSIVYRVLKNKDVEMPMIKWESREAIKAILTKLAELIVNMDDVYGTEYINQPGCNYNKKNINNLKKNGGFRFVSISENVNFEQGGSSGKKQKDPKSQRKKTPHVF